MNIWQFLEIDETHDQNIIKTAYAKKLKNCKPEVDPEGFKQLRLAYEKALSFSQGESVNIDMTESSPVPEAKGNDPVNLAYSILDALQNDEKTAIELVQNLSKKGELDNLEFSNEMQKALAINLLTITPGYKDFVWFVFDFFNWRELLDYQSDGMFRVALRNLYNQTEPIRFMLYLSYISKLTEGEATKDKIKWSTCEAARVLLTDPNKYLGYPKDEVIVEVKNYINEIMGKYPESLFLGINQQAFMKWKDYVIEPKKKKSSKFHFIFVFAQVAFVCFVALKSYVPYLNDRNSVTYSNPPSQISSPVPSVDMKNDNAVMNLDTSTPLTKTLDRLQLRPSKF